MDILEILTGLNIDEDVAKKAEKAINKAIPLEFVKKDQYNKKVSELDETAQERDDARAALAAAEPYKKKYEDEVAAHNKTKEDHAAKDTRDAKIAALSKQLLEDGANPKMVKLLVKEFDLDKVELDGGKVKGWDDLSKPVKAEYADVFGKVKQTGADVGNPPANNGGEKNPFLKENYNLAAQTALFKKDPALARQMAAEAGVKL